ncbi:helix-turn-helix transcriptional regulator [Shewanella sp. KX20019]|uniref:helix-turn-helix domain-containing protein n=1 Tax=Shewanella sp. KX20019 TaxID=2803864 RepID=UPI001928BC9E|nr:AraC family transcriptional regulator [Shewanella sp. KX20019]QQX82387.1 helix-turn-helix transcriptional regulator [Shewanella sp. KX20019]
MQSWIHYPKNIKVAKYISCYWLIEKTTLQDINNFPKLNPDPATHLIICPQKQGFHYDTAPQVSSGSGSHWLFPQQQTLQIDHSERFIYLGVKFHIGALYSLDIPDYNHPTLNQADTVDMDHLLSVTGFPAESLLQIGRTEPLECCDKLDELFLPLLTNAKEDQHSEITHKVLQLLDSTAVSELGGKLFCSQRTLERSFNRVTGLTMKQCQSMNKLEAMLEYLYQRDASDIDWVDVAFKFGFSDQPHLIRQLKKQIGLTPKHYVEERGLTIDIYGGVTARD